MSDETAILAAARAAGRLFDVVGAVIVQGGRALIVQRPPESWMGGYFELPGGKVEPGETLAAAVAREVGEETGLAPLAVGAYLGCFDYDSRGGKPCRQFNFMVEAAPGEIALQEHIAFAWLAPDELERYPISPEVASVLRGLPGW
ncbi:MAG TPA: NUDIX domain-containing protein [Herpetosiphonaceae bacterium]